MPKWIIFRKEWYIVALNHNFMYNIVYFSDFLASLLMFSEFLG